MSNIKQHTPGTYHVEKRTTPGEFVTDTLIVAKDGSVLATVGPCNIDANAVLFAAAPELLQMLIECEDRMAPEVFRDLHPKLRAAIARATGKG